MSQSRTRIRDLRKQFPFLEEIIRREECMRPPLLDIKVQRGDTTLLYTQGTRNNGVEFDIKPEGTRVHGKSRDRLYSVLMDGRLADRNQITWCDEHDRACPVYPASLLDNGYLRCPVKYLVWVKRVESYSVQRNLVWVHHESELTITVYLAPDRGWEGLLIEANPLKNVWLTYPGLPGGKSENPYCAVIRDQLVLLERDFLEQVYANGLQALVQNSRTNPLRGELSHVSLLVGQTANHLRFTLRHGGLEVVFQPWRPPGYYFLCPKLYSMEGTLPSLNEMVQQFIRTWVGLSPEARCAVMKSVC